MKTHHKSAIPMFTGFLAYATFTLLDTLLKIVTTDNSLITIIFILNFAALCYFVLIFSVIGWKKAVIYNIRFYVIRSVFHTGAVVSIVYSFSQFGLNYVYAVIFAAPFLTTLLGKKFLNEPVTRTAWIAMGVGFLGVFIALRPWHEALQLKHAAVFFAALMISLSVIILKGIGKKESPLCISFYGSVCMSVLFAFMNIFFYQAMPLNDIMILIFCGLLMVLSTTMVTHSFQRLGFATMGTIQYTQFIWGTIFSFLFFRELPDFYFYVGAGLICLAGFIDAGGRLFRIKWL